MKLLPYKRKRYLEKRSRQFIKRRSKRHVRQHKAIETNLHETSFESLWNAPKIFGLTNAADREQLLSAIRKLRYQVGVKRIKSILDFSNTEKIFADGGLLFWAELKRLIKFIGGGVELSCVLPNNNKVAQVLKQIGVLDLLGTSTHITPADDDVVNWRCASGSKVLGEKYDDILSQYDGEITEILQNHLYTGITEAMTNTLNHGNLLKRDDGLATQPTTDWWMFSQQQNNHLSVVFCDLGAGIPNTLPVTRPNVWNRLLRKGIRGDGEVIKFAVKDSVSRTKKAHRGKGLRQIVEVISEIKDAKVLVLSNKGAFTSTYGGITKCVNYKDSILGTLIFWSIPL